MKLDSDPQHYHSQRDRAAALSELPIRFSTVAARADC